MKYVVLSARGGRIILEQVLLPEQGPAAQLMMPVRIGLETLGERAASPVVLKGKVFLCNLMWVPPIIYGFF